VITFIYYNSGSDNVNVNDIGIKAAKMLIGKKNVPRSSMQVFKACQEQVEKISPRSNQETKHSASVRCVGEVMTRKSRR